MYYFAYGANMNLKDMRRRCPNAQFIKRVFLEEYQFVYDFFGDDREGAVADIIPSPGGRVWGALFLLDQAGLAALDDYEGYPRHYRRETFRVVDDAHKGYEAIAYFRVGLKTGKPSEDYHKAVIKGARDCGLPKAYIAKCL
ncbi:MAG: gamma-glutamylcyclotransferase family protein [Nitrospiria bacterium]